MQMHDREHEHDRAAELVHNSEFERHMCQKRHDTERDLREHRQHK